MQSTTTMNDGTPGARSAVAAFKFAKNDSSESEGVARKREASPEDTAPAGSSSSLQERVKKHAAGNEPRKGARMQMAEILREAAEAGGVSREKEGDFEMNMIPMTFPQRLHDILSNDEHKDVISWLSSGDAFMIHDRQEFAESVLPRYFKESKFPSFTRKLNRWGFQRITKGPESGAYFHPHFQRGNLRRTLLMQCTQRNDGKKKRAPKRQAANQTSTADALQALGLGSIFSGQHSEAEQMMRLQQLEQQLQATKARYEEQKREEQVAASVQDGVADALLREHQRIVALQELQQQQQQQELSAAAGQVESALGQYQNLLNQMSRSPACSNQGVASLAASTQESALNPFLQGASGMGSSLAASLSSGNPSLAAAAASMSSPPQRSSSSSLSAADERSSALEIARALQRTDPNAYMQLLMSASQRQDSQAQAVAEQNQRAQQEKLLRDLIMQRATSLPPKKR